ncbi:MAG: PAS domain S-box protein [Desulfobacterales bacterium]|nr:PAS domain S-box protein [Desulfobacterales bacterium]
MKTKISDKLNRIVEQPNNLTRILDNLQEGIIAHDLDRTIFFFNKTAETITGYSREEILNRDCHLAFGTPFCSADCNFCGDSSPAADTTKKALTITTKSGEQRRIDMTVTMMNDEAGNPFGVLVSFKDLTDLINLQIKAGDIRSFSNIIGQDIKMLHVFQQIKDVAAYDYPVHVYGETGTGKELVAAAIHSESPRNGGPFVPINCGALPESLIESELFGHVKGSFSGAIRDKKGRFELSDKGTIFLDEVAELSKLMQVKLLRFLQDGTFERVGGEKTQKVDVRVISATNKDLMQEIREERFREDLYYRLNVIPVNLPPLRERRTDIPLLVSHFLKEAGRRNSSPVPTITDDALGSLMDHEWPGNVRELQNAVQFAIVKSTRDIIKKGDLPPEISRLKSGEMPHQNRSGKLDIESVQTALKTTGGNKAKAAKLLGVGRATLYRFLGANEDVF